MRLRAQQQQQQRRPRYFRDRSNPLEDLEADEVFERYRFRPDTVMFILGLLPNLQRKTQRNHPLTPLLQVLLCLRFLATGAIHLLIGDSLNISRSTAGRCIRETTAHLASLFPRFVKFPSGNAALETNREFSAIAGKKLKIAQIYVTIFCFLVSYPSRFGPDSNVLIIFICLKLSHKHNAYPKSIYNVMNTYSIHWIEIMLQHIYWNIYRKIMIKPYVIILISAW